SLPPLPESAKTQTNSNRLRWDQLTGSDDGSTPQQQPKAQQVVNRETPNLLDLSSLERRANGSESGDRNPFEYPPPPLPPPVKPPPPPTINLNGISTSVKPVYAKTKAFEVVIRGINLSPDMSIYLQGNPRFSKTIFVSDSEIKAMVPESFFTNPGILRFEVKKIGQEINFFSNHLEIEVKPPQDPNTLFKMVGQFTDTDGSPHAVLSEVSSGETKPIQMVKIKDIVNLKNPRSTDWEVVSINKNTIEVKDVKEAIGVTWSVKMKDDMAGKTGNVAYNPQQAIIDQAYVDNGNPYTDPNGTINLNEALQNQNAQSSILGQTPEDLERSKQIQQQNFKLMNEVMQKQRDAIIRQREQQLQQQPQQPFIRNQPVRNR
ncbi:MAG: hypothetical protein FD167_1462, partial [bacterium]